MAATRLSTDEPRGTGFGATPCRSLAWRRSDPTTTARTTTTALYLSAARNQENAACEDWPPEGIRLYTRVLSIFIVPVPDIAPIRRRQISTDAVILLPASTMGLSQPATSACLLYHNHRHLGRCRSSKRLEAAGRKQNVAGRTRASVSDSSPCPSWECRLFGGRAADASALTDPAHGVRPRPCSAMVFHGWAWCHGVSSMVVQSAPCSSSPCPSGRRAISPGVRVRWRWVW